MEIEAFGLPPAGHHYSESNKDADIKQLLRQVTILVGVFLVVFLTSVSIQCASTWGNFRESWRHRLLLQALNGVLCCLVLGYILRTEFQLAL